ncbi:MAG: Crp/Fnr family transcriptional regulator [Alphaproteobacteria bacterium]|nr:Crp/Fnr family transcriptional regulator [Alphaproteobacteria bacterium]
MSTVSNNLDGIRCLEALPQNVRDVVARSCAWRTYGAGEIVVGESDGTTDVFFIVGGTVRVVIYSEEGKEVIFRDLPAGSIFGELSAIDDQPRSASVVAVIESHLASITSRQFWQLAAEHPEFTAAILRHLTANIRSLTERVFEFSTLAVRNRIHAELLRLALEGNIEGGAAVVAPAPTHADIASRVSTHREAVTRELSSLARNGVIRRERGRIVVPDIRLLHKMVADVLGDDVKFVDEGGDP